MPGRRGTDEATIYAPVGLPWQDLALTWDAYRRALDSGTGAEDEMPDSGCGLPISVTRRP